MMPQDRKCPRARWSQHKGNARKAGIAFLLSFDEWWRIWSRSGHYKERGQHRGQYVMARFKDKGPYAIGNVKIIKHEDNDREGNLHPWSDQRKKNVRATLLRRNASQKQRHAVSVKLKQRWKDADYRKMMRKVGSKGGKASRKKRIEATNKRDGENQ